MFNRQSLSLLTTGLVLGAACSSPSTPPASPSTAPATPLSSPLAPSSSNPIASGEENPTVADEKPLAVKPRPKPAQPITPAVVRDENAPSDVGAIPNYAVMTESGIAYRILDAGPGTGTPAKLIDSIEARFKSWSSKGEALDSSPDDGQQVETIKLSEVPEPLANAFQLLLPGQRARLWVPARLVEGFMGKVGPHFVVDVELVSIKPGTQPPIDVAQPPKSAKSLTNGVRYRVVTRGRGKRRPRSHDNVEVHYVGWTTDGSTFDSSRERNKTATFALDAVIEGWTIALGKMREGDRWVIWIPEELAYKGRPGKPAGMLVFDVELLKVIAKPGPQKAPRDVKNPPRSAKKTKSGVHYRFLGRRSRRGEKPKETDTVVVSYTGWTTDGKMFDSSKTRGKPASFGLNRVIPGFRDGIQQMRVGDKVRIWIPEELAYKGKRPPMGVLVFDIELIEIK